MANSAADAADNLKRIRHASIERESRRRRSLSEIERLLEDLHWAVEDMDITTSQITISRIDEYVQGKNVRRQKYDSSCDLTEDIAYNKIGQLGATSERVWELLRCDPSNLLLSAINNFAHNRCFVMKVLLIVVLLFATAIEVKMNKSQFLSFNESILDGLPIDDSTNDLLDLYKHDGEVASLIIQTVYYHLRLLSDSQSPPWVGWIGFKPKLPFSVNKNTGFITNLIKIMLNFSRDLDINEYGILIISFLLKKLICKELGLRRQRWLRTQNKGHHLTPKLSLEILVRAK